VIAAVTGHCVGGGVDLVTCADVRLCDATATFTVKEVDVGLAADVGTVQRLRDCVTSSSVAREMIFTARPVGAAEAVRIGLVSGVYGVDGAAPGAPDGETGRSGTPLLAAALEMAAAIASKSPVAVAGSKRSVVRSRDLSVAEGLEDIRLWNMSMLGTQDIPASMAVMAGKMDAAKAFPNLTAGTGYVHEK
jgi:enoyl-CoA hydratase/carnithine racemase